MRKMMLSAVAAAELFVQINNKELDILVAGLGATTERRKTLAFSNTYYRSRSFFRKLFKTPLQFRLAKTSNCHTGQIAVTSLLKGTFEELPFGEFPSLNFQQAWIRPFGRKF